MGKAPSTRLLIDSLKSLAFIEYTYKLIEKISFIKFESFSILKNSFFISNL